MSIRDVCEKLWKGEVDFASWHPVSTPYLEAEELEDGVLYYKGLAGATTIDTGDGLVMLDTGGELDTARLHQQVRRWRADTHLAAAIFSHHHVDHIFGVGPFEQEAVDKGWGAAGLRPRRHKLAPGPLQEDAGLEHGDKRAAVRRATERRLPLAVRVPLPRRRVSGAVALRSW